MENLRVRVHAVPKQGAKANQNLEAHSGEEKLRLQNINVDRIRAS